MKTRDQLEIENSLLREQIKEFQDRERARIREEEKAKILKSRCRHGRLSIDDCPQCDVESYI